MSYFQWKCCAHVYSTGALKSDGLCRSRHLRFAPQIVGLYSEQHPSGRSTGTARVGFELPSTANLLPAPQLNQEGSPRVQ